MRNIAEDIKGSIAVNFAILLTLLLLSVGIAIDYSSIVRERTNLQAYADAAVLAAAISGEKEKPKLNEIVLASISAQTSTNPDVSLVLLNEDPPKARVIVKSNHTPFILGAFGYNDFIVSAVSESPVGGGKKLNLALVLDTTKSMEGTRINTLKSASSELLNSIQQSVSDPTEARVSLVPFADYVRIDTSNLGQTWLNAQADFQHTYQTLDMNKSINCRQVGSGELATTQCDTTVHKDVTITAKWEGCMASRKDGYHKIAEFKGKQLQGPAARVGCNNAYNTLQPLTSNLNDIDSAIQGFDTIGDTYLPSGLIWGWRTLDPSLPFDEAKTSNKDDTLNVLLLMTDGSNTTSLRGERTGFEGLYHWGHGNDLDRTTKEANALTEELCTSIKLNNIEIITVAFEVTDPVTLNLMKNCASSPSKFYNSQNSSALKRAFATIADRLNAIRLSR